MKWVGPAFVAVVAFVSCFGAGMGANVSAGNRRGARPLHYASDGNPATARFNDAGQRDVIRIVVAHGADPNAVDKSGVALLHRAVRGRCAGAVEELLLAGSDPRMKNRAGSTPLHLAVQDTRRGGSGRPESRAAQEEIVRILLAHGARVDDRDGRGQESLGHHRFIEIPLSPALSSSSTSSSP